jgi:hypothetical protein
MGAHNIPAKLMDKNAVFPASGSAIFTAKGPMIAWGTTVPADTAKGYPKGCIFIHTSAASNADLLYSNIGDETSADFNAITVAA